MNENGNGKTSLTFQGRISLRDILLLLSFLGVGGHSYYTVTNFSKIQKEYQACQARLDKLERSLKVLPGPNPSGDATGPPPVPQTYNRIAPDYTRKLVN